MRIWRSSPRRKGDPCSCRAPDRSDASLGWRPVGGRIELLYTKFISTLSQRQVLERILPVEAADDAAEGIPGNQFIFEPDPATVLEQLLPRYVATRLYQAVLEAKASEESSRMVAMKNATENAEELIDDLTLSYNKVRQANITREMIEIASGARAR